MKLYCVRHGEAEGPEVEGRPLTPNGVAEIEREAAQLACIGVAPVQLWHSPKTRAVQTATIFAKALNAPQMTVCEHLLDSEQDTAPMHELISTWHEDTMLVSHLPFIAKLAGVLLGSDAEHFPLIDFAPGTVVCLERYGGERWMIAWVLNPRLLLA